MADSSREMWAAGRGRKGNAVSCGIVRELRVSCSSREVSAAGTGVRGSRKEAVSLRYLKTDQAGS